MGLLSRLLGTEGATRDLLADLSEDYRAEAAQAKRRRLVEQIAHWDPEEPEMAALLRRIEQEDQGQQPVYEALIMRSDPQSID